MDKAIAAIAAAAHPGDIVLLAPACSSFDQFESYEHRGRVFKELINEWRVTRGLPALLERTH
jgi:UDP-N-acetylmuramoylalanine--D-glutamate ligase